MPKIKVCFVPACTNTSKNVPSKIFITVPRNPQRRKTWYKAAKVQKLLHLAHDLYCCEDHFNLQEDCSNWMYFKIMGTVIKLKPHVVPHKFIDYQPEITLPSALTDSAKKQKAEVLKRIATVSNDQTMPTSSSKEFNAAEDGFYLINLK